MNEHPDIEPVVCGLCGEDNYDIVYKTYSGDLALGQDGYKITDHDVNAPVRIVRCRRCGLSYMNPRFSMSRLLEGYNRMADEAYLEQEAGRRLSARRILKKLKRSFKPGARLLDVGCATGFLLDEARRQGWDVHGVELSRWAVDFAKDKMGLGAVFHGTLKEAGFAANHFDVVVLQDVIEHLENPKDVLVEIRRILKPAGLVCVNTPNIESLVSRLLKARWWGIKQSHLFYFTPQTLKKMLEAAGFHLLGVRSHARNFTLKYWVEKLSQNNKLLGRPFLFLAKDDRWGQRMVTINLGDQMDACARKSRKLAYLDELEVDAPPQDKKKARVVIVLPAYNAAKTLAKTIADIPKDQVDDIILVDDASRDNTVSLAKQMGLNVFVHPRNKGYGANQKTCYTQALAQGADIVVMVHPDYQYDPKAIPALIEPILTGRADAVFGSRMMKRGALEGGMPLWKHNANIFLTALENVVLGTYLTEYHSGFRAYSSRYLESVRFMENSDGFIFDTEIIVQGLVKYMRIEEVPIRTRYFDEASTIKLGPSILYGLGILKTLATFILHQRGWVRFRCFE